MPPYFIVKTLGAVCFTHPLVTVHRLKAILARLLPVLASINKENMQWVVATALGQFCAAAMDFVANKGEDVVSITSFASDVFPAFEILFSKWTKARDRKVVVASLQACGYILALLPKAQYEQLVPKVIPVMLQLWRGGGKVRERKDKEKGKRKKEKRNRQRDLESPIYIFLSS